MDNMSHTTEPDESGAVISGLEHGVERRSADLREGTDLGLGHPRSDCFFRKSGDGIGLGLGLRSGSEPGPAVALQSGADVVHEHSVKYLTSTRKERKVLSMARTYLIDVNDTVRPARPVGMSGAYMRHTTTPPLGRVVAASSDSVSVLWDAGHTTTYTDDDLDFIERCSRPRRKRAA